MAALALSPIFLLIVMLFALRMPLVFAAPVSFVFTTFIALYFWSLPAPFIFAAVLKAALLTTDIVFIVFGAIFFLNYLKDLGSIQTIEKWLKSLSPDRRIQAILIAWFFGSFIEGTAGFGTPAAIVAPLLVAIGFPALTAILVSLAANSTAVAFGAVGTPVRIGLEGLNIQGVSVRAAVINVFAGFLVPLIIVTFVIWTKKENRWQSIKQCLPWSLLSGVAFLLPYFLFSLIGYEFPSLLGSAIGLLLIVLSLRFKIFLPSTMWYFDGENPLSLSSEAPAGLVKASFPYLLLIVLLLMGKFIFANATLTLALPEGLGHSIHLFNPGFAFLTTVGVIALYRRDSFQVLAQSSLATFKPLAKASVSILFISSIAQVMLVTGWASLPHPGMLQSLVGLFGSTSLPYVSSALGALGSFVAGSATVSNLIFGPIQSQISQQLGLATSWILALQLVGSGAGNMIALPNILAVQAATGWKGNETQILARLIIPCFLYLLIATMAGTILMKFF